MNNEFETYPLEPEVEDITCIPTVPVLDEPVPVEQTLDMSSTINEDDKYTIGKFFGTLQESVVAIWKYHLSTDKHFIHVELERTYHCLLGYTDNLIEIYQGIIGAVINKDEYINVIEYHGVDCLNYIYELKDYILKGKNFLFDSMSEMCSKIDDILETLDLTTYKITAFKEQPVQTFESFCYSHYAKLNESCDECGDTILMKKSKIY